MLLAYVDESYDANRYWIIALVCPEESVIPLTRALDHVVEKAAASYDGVAADAELHGHTLFHGIADWSSLTAMARARIGVYNDAFAAIGESDAEVLIRGVHVPRLRERYARPYHPHEVVLGHVLEKVDECAEKHDALALVIADEVDQADTYRRRLWHFQRFSTPGYRARRLDRIADTIHFAPSHASRLLQAADLVAFLYRRMDSDVERDDRAVRANAALWARVAPKVVHQWCWTP